MSFSDCDDDDGDIISDGPASMVTRVEPKSTDGSAQFIAVKRSNTAHAKEPHDIVKEVRLLAALSHPNIIQLIDQELSQGSLSFRMPYIPHSLDELLKSSGFSPHPIVSFGNTSSSSLTLREVQFTILTKSIIFQILCGVSYLHSEHVQIAHRDIKPSNILLTPSGCAQIIDFGIAFRPRENSAAKVRDLWPESTERMYFEVSTGPYRAPELLFGPRTYDAFAIDAWSLGTTLAEFFTPLLLGGDEDEDEAELSFARHDHTSDSKSDSELSSTGSPAPSPPPTPFIIPRGTRPGIPTGRWTRASLFDASRGEIGLAWSIFKIRGTPNQDTWPSFLGLPDGGKLSFVDVNAAELGLFLPNLPPSESSVPVDTRTYTPSEDLVPSALDLIHRFLVHEPSRRLRPSEALSHPWFKTKPELVMPRDVNNVGNVDGPLVEVTRNAFMLEGRIHTLGDLLRRYVGDKE